MVSAYGEGDPSGWSQQHSLLQDKGKGGPLGSFIILAHSQVTQGPVWPLQKRVSAYTEGVPSRSQQHSFLQAIDTGGPPTRSTTVAQSHSTFVGVIVGVIEGVGVGVGVRQPSGSGSLL